MSRTQQVLDATKQASAKMRGDPLPECFGWAHGLTGPCSVCALAPECRTVVAVRRLDRRTLVETWTGTGPFGLAGGTVPDLITHMLRDRWVEYHALVERVKHRFGAHHARVTLRWTLKHLARRGVLWKRVHRMSGATLYHVSPTAP